MNDSFMIQLKKSSLLSWERACELSQLAFAVPEAEYFPYGVRVPIDNFPDLLPIAKQYRFRKYFFVLKQTEDSREVPLHVDGKPNDMNTASINWPIQNCNHLSPTKWYQIDNPEIIERKESYFLVNKSEAKLIYENFMDSSLKSPYLFRSDYWHSGYNNSSQERIILKWELYCDDWGEAQNRFAQFIEDKR